jgi:hypothetical protein
MDGNDFNNPGAERQETGKDLVLAQQSAYKEKMHIQI